MKKSFAVWLFAFMLFSCADEKKQETDLLKQVVTVHDRVMEKDELVINNKRQLDSIVKHDTSRTVKNTVTQIKTKLDAANSKMEDWMHNFDAENKGKSHAEIINYLTDQKRQITMIDSQLNVALVNARQFVIQK